MAVMALVIASVNSADEDCEACGLLVWRMQTIVAARASALESMKRAKEKRAAKSTKAHSKRWLKQEYGIELSGAIEAEVDSLQQDSRIIHGACRLGFEAIEGSALRGGRFDLKRCESRVRRSVGELLDELQDELVSAVISGLGAGAACEKLVPQCTAGRAQLLLGSNYRDGMSWRELDYLQIGYSDTWTLHHDVDDSVYWFNKAKMRSQKEPPEGWAQDAEGAWKRVDGAPTAPASKDEV